ncbi:YdaS family helix-turn-helix protein [Enterobacter bugandensis]|uniref:transcriptional regulator n=1 Tax=Enterobacter bugandensis TaxID=881260 RepID=UPI00200329B6|nr:YdaS family helix-turn-helix protein [Enterobacter bugandensis]MCK6877187.1 YdaS family helix-turn-helix protein [Enterobacter bugandensis]
MKLKDYLDQQGPEARLALQQLLGIKKSYLSQLASGRAVISPARCHVIKSFTKGRVDLPDLRPTDWHLIWPDYNTENGKESD